jgi:hypothetical protein
MPVYKEFLTEEETLDLLTKAMHPTSGERSRSYEFMREMWNQHEIPTLRKEIRAASGAQRDGLSKDRRANVPLGTLLRIAQSLAIRVRVSGDTTASELGYTISGAARALAKRYSIPEWPTRNRIFEAAERGDLMVFDPKTCIPYVPRSRCDFYERVRPGDLNKWFKANNVPYELPDYVVPKAVQESVSDDSSSAGMPGAQRGTNPSAIWQAEARRCADRLHLKDKKAGAHSSSADLAERIAEDFRARGIDGRHGPLTGATILREAIQGKKWNRPTPGDVEGSGESGKSGKR